MNWHRLNKMLPQQMRWHLKSVVYSNKNIRDMKQLRQNKKFRDLK